MLFLVFPVCARDLCSLNSVKYDCSLISFSASWQVNSFKYLRIICSMQFSFFFIFLLMQLQFRNFPNYLIMQLQFSPELILCIMHALLEYTSFRFLKYSKQVLVVDTQAFVSTRLCCPCKNTRAFPSHECFGRALW